LVDPAARDRFLILHGYTPAGLSNQRMELEIKIALAHLARRTLVVSNRIPIDLQGADAAATLTELFNVPVRFLQLQEFVEQYPDAAALELPWGEPEDAYFASADGARAAEVRDRFANGRTSMWTFEEDLEQELAIGSRNRLLSWYSYFFLVSQAEFLEIRDLIQGLKPKPEYVEFAREFAAYLGRYNAIHIRRGDFLRWWVRIPDATEIVANLEEVIGRDDPLLICTDGPSDRDYFRPIVEHFTRACFLDDLLARDWSIRVGELRFSDRGALALLTQLIAAEGEFFAGTLFSTFTGFIHRQRLFERGERTFRYVSSPFPKADVGFERCAFQTVEEGFSWNQVRYPLSPGAHSWFREWPESETGPFPSCT